MPGSSKGEVVLVRYPFSDLSASKVRPAVVVHAPHVSQDALIVPLTSRITHLLPGEFALADWGAAGLNVPTAVKRGIYTVRESLFARSLGLLSPADARQVEESVRFWLGLVGMARLSRRSNALSRVA